MVTYLLAPPKNIIAKFQSLLIGPTPTTRLLFLSTLQVHMHYLLSNKLHSQLNIAIRALFNNVLMLNTFILFYLFILASYETSIGATRGCKYSLYLL